MKAYYYTAVLQPDSEKGGYTAYIPALRGCVAEDETIRKALRFLRKVTRDVLSSKLGRGEKIPKDKKPHWKVTRRAQTERRLNLRFRTRIIRIRVLV